MKPRTRMIAALLLLFPAAWPARQAAGAEPGGAELGGVHVSFFLDLYYAAAKDAAADGRNFAGSTATAGREGEFALDLAGVELRCDPAPFGFTLALAGGDEMMALHLAEEPSARDSFRHVYQASASYRQGKLAVEAGLFPSHIGFEGAFPHANWNYSHSWTATLSPFYQTGVKLTYAPDDATTLELHALNGWQQIADVNRGKSVGARLARRFGPIGATLNAIYGDEPDGLGGQHPRALYDLILAAEPAPGWSLAAEAYRGRQQREPGPAADWDAIAGWAHWQHGRHALTLRAERFDDGDGGISGTAQRLASYTATWDLRMHESARLRLELRRDDSTAALFGGEKRQELGLLALELTF